MNTIITIDKAGRVVIPIQVRENMQLSSGDRLELEVGGDGVILRPLRTHGRLFKKQGVWVYDSGKSLGRETARKVLNDVRHERDRKNHASDS